MFAGLAAGCAPPSSSGGVDQTSIYTPARESFAEAVSDFFGWRADAEQPIEFPHVAHTRKKIACAACHRSVARGPVAGIPGVKDCLGCHRVIAKDRPLIRQITAMRAKGVDLAWQRVYGFTPQAHVRFHHGAHIRAGVECVTCHGDVASQTVAQRNVDLTMGFCVSCHRERHAPDDCLTCHK